MLLKPNEVHLIAVNLACNQQDEYYPILALDEQMRAMRYRLPMHQMYYSTARVLLRRILAKYLAIKPQEIVFSYGEHQKPYLSEQHKAIKDIHFNLSHSKDWAVFALRLQEEIGVDIQHIQLTYSEKIVQRYFTAAEAAILESIHPLSRAKQFYQLWAKKEAFTKALGKGLQLNFKSFELPIVAPSTVFNYETVAWHIQTLDLHSEYAAALATPAPITKIQYLNFTDVDLHK